MGELVTLYIIQFVAAIFVLALIGESSKINKYPIKETFITFIIPLIGIGIMGLIILDLVKKE